MANKPFTILVGIDFSSLSDAAFARALETAARNPGAELHAVFVAPSIGMATPYLVTGVGKPLESVDELNAALERHVRSLFHAALPSLDSAGLGAPTRIVSHVRLESPVFGVLQLATDIEADLIVLGTHGRRGPARWALGSVAEAVIRHAVCPVLVVPPHAPEPSVPAIEPPCPNCIAERRASNGVELWCAQHRERHGQRHTYYQTDRVSAETNLPIFAH